MTCVVQLFVGDNFKTFVAWLYKIAAPDGKMYVRFLLKYPLSECMSLTLQEKEPLACSMSQFEVPRHCYYQHKF